MLIGFDASRATRAYRRGPEQYSFYLLKALAKIDQKNQYLLYSPVLPPDELKNLPPNFQWKIMPFPRLWTQLRLSWEMFINPPDLLFIPSHIVPIIHPQKTVVTVHDLGFKYYPAAYSLFSRFYENFSIRFLLKKTKKIIAISKATKDDLVKFSRLEPEKITAIYHGRNEKLYYPIKKREVDYPYLFYLGSLEKKKNIIGLLEAFEKVKATFPDGKSGSAAKAEYLKLVLGGKPGYRYQEIRQKIDSLSGENKKDIKELGYLSDKEAGFWMRNASVFVLPSFFEGFGIPLIEAMACGVPVVASNILALSEIAGRAAFLINPKSPDAIARGIKEIISNKKLKKDLIKKGLKRAKEFSWEKCAQETLTVLEEAGKGKI